MVKLFFYNPADAVRVAARYACQKNEFHPSPSDVVLGILGTEQKATFYMGDSHFTFAENMHTILDAQPGSSGSFSLDCGSGFAFITQGRLYSDEELASLPPVVRVGY